MRRKTKQLLSFLLSLVMLVSMIPTVPVRAEEDKYAYTIFASSTQSGAVSITADWLTVNGSIATNGTINSSKELSINGEVVEHAGLSMVSLGSKLDTTYFSSGGESQTGDYVSPVAELNQNINQPLVVGGTMKLTGNVNLNAAVKSGSDMVIECQTMNANNCVMYTSSGDIVIKGDNVSFTGLIYAPNGSVEITAQNLNLNNVILLAETVTLTCMGANINYNESMGRFIGLAGTGGGSVEVRPTTAPTETPVTPAVPTETPPEPTAAPVEPEKIEISAFGTYDDSTDTVEIWWNSNYEKGTYELYESPDNVTEYTLINTVQYTDYYLYSVGDFTGTKYIKVVLVTEEGERLEAVPFSFTVTEEGAEVVPLDSDGDGIPDATELKLGMDPYGEDADGDGFTDYEEIFELGTDPTAQDADSDRDSDKDGLTNVEEYKVGTNLYSADTDGDGLTDREELK